MNYYLKSTEEFGRGLYADFNIHENKEVFISELLVFSEEDTIKLENTDLKFYKFKFNDTQDCLCLGLGEIFNHSDTPNVGYKLIDFDGRKVMQFYTLRPVQSGEQLFINYNSDIKVDTNQYIDKNLI